MQNSKCTAGHPDIFCYTEHENNKLNKEVSSEDTVGTQDYRQNKFPFRYIKEFVELALIYMNELGLNLFRNIQETETSN